MKILLASDGSKPALHAAEYAIALIRQLAALPESLTLISVHDDAALQRAKPVVGSAAVADYLRELSDKDVAPVAALLNAAGLRFDVAVRTGHVAQEIVKFAKDGAFDLIVMGAKGRNPMLDMLLGSVAQHVLAHAQTPVLLVR